MSDESKAEAIKPREYQINLFNVARKRNTLIVLPTGLGKTLIAAMVAEDVLNRGGKVIFMAPTKPLVSQHMETFSKYLNLKPPDIFSFTGEIDSMDRRFYWTRSRVIVSTPQVVWNDMKRGDLDISSYSLLIFDEAHRATGNYSYALISRKFLETRSRLTLAMTASPGGSREKLDEIRENLGIEEVLIKSETDPDVSPYVGGITVKTINLDLPPELKDIGKILRSIMDPIQEKLRQAGIIRYNRASRKELASKVPQLVERAKAGNPALFSLIPYVTALIRLDYVMEYIESQGASVAYQYLKNILESEDNSIKRTARILEKNPATMDLLNSLEKASMDQDSNPKLSKALQLCEEKISSNPESRIIIFTHFRKTASIVNDYLEKHSALIRPVKFVGQASKEGDAGMNQKEQDEILSKFRSNIYNVLVATSVAEEGLDIPSTDLVIFFEPVPSEIRTIQRRGRTGRMRAGDVYILMYSGTRDAGYYYSSRKKEATMGRNIERTVAKIEKDTSRARKEPTNLDDFF